MILYFLLAPGIAGGLLYESNLREIESCSPCLPADLSGVVPQDEDGPARPGYGEALRPDERSFNFTFYILVRRSFNEGGLFFALAKESPLPWWN